MDKRTCRLCGRRFANGLARAGHMRSHALAAAKARPIIPASPSSSEATAACYGPRGNPRTSSRAADPDFSAVAAVDAAASSSVVQDGESDAESSIALGPSLLLPGRRRSKRPASPPERISSSVSSVTPEEDVARCLMMLSRDVWTESTAAEKEGAGSEEKDRIAGDRSRRGRKPLPVAGQSGYQCGTCKKVFGSYHALGGHRAGHKKAKGSCVPAGQIRIHADGSDVDLINERSFGFRIYSSNQALVSPLLRPSPIGANHISISPADPKLGAESSIIDLNRPAPGGEVQDFELSAVSVAEFAPDE